MGKYEFHTRNDQDEVPFMRGWTYEKDGTIKLRQAVDREVAEEVDNFSEELGPPELAELPVFSAALYYEHGGTKLRAYAMEQVRQKNLGSSWAEFGVERGLSAYFWTHYLADDGQLYLFDSWEGLPEQWVKRRDVDDETGVTTLGGMPVGAFAGHPPEFHDDKDRVHLVKGWFEDTLPKADMGELGFLHIDCDLYSAAKTVLQRCNEQIVPGTIILFDELWGYQCWREGEYQALMEWDR